MLTHLVEAHLWWFLAIAAGYLDNTTPLALAKRLVSPNRSPAEAKLFIILIVVPVIVSIFIISGPKTAQVEKEKSKKTN